MSVSKKPNMLIVDDEDETTPQDTPSKKRKSMEILDDEDANDKPIPAPKKLKTNAENAVPTSSSKSHKKQTTLLTEEPGVMHENYNEDICEILQQLGEIEKNAGQLYKYRAYVQAVNSLKYYPKRIESGAEARKLPGIGVKIAKKIDEILQTGQLQRLENDLNDPNVQALNLISRVVGIGPVLARKLVFEDGVRTLDDLRKMKGLSHQIQVGLKYFDDLEKKIPREEMVKHEKILLKTAAEIDPQLTVQVCGSYRRGLPFSGDVDCLLMHPAYDMKQKERHASLPSFDKFVDALSRSGYICETLAFGPSKFMGICKLPEEGSIARRIDLKLFPHESYYCALLHFTGSGEHNRQLRALALEKSYKLSEYGLYPIGSTGKIGDPIPITSEEDVFGILGIPYREPSQRSL